MSKQRQTNVCLCNSSLRKQCLALFSDHDLKDIRVNTNQFKEKFAKRLFGITEVNHIILHPIQLRSISVPLCLFSCSKQVHTPQLTCSLTHTNSWQTNNALIVTIAGTALISHPSTAQTQTQPRCM